MFYGCTVPPDSKESKLGNSDLETSSSACKNAGVVLVPCHPSKCVHTAISNLVDIFEVSLYDLLQHEISVRITKINSRIGVS